MALLKEISDLQSGVDPNTMDLRFASRGVFFDKNNNIPVLLVTKHNYPKLPGGGIHQGEDKVQALHRELQEETGCTVKITDEIGEIIEYRSEFNLKQISYCYYGTILTKGEPSFTEKEIAAGFEIAWMSIDDAIGALENADPGQDYQGAFIKQRDLEILKRVRQIIN